MTNSAKITSVRKSGELANKMKLYAALLFLCFVVFHINACKKAAGTNLDHGGSMHFRSDCKNYKGLNIPIEWTDRKPPLKENSLKIKEGDSFDKVIELLGIPFQDSGKDNNIWHYRLDDNTYLQIIGSDKIEKLLRYTDKDMK